MNSFEERSCPSALIPWVFALVALIGCNALLPNLAQARKGRDLDGCSITQITGDCGPETTDSRSQVVFTPDGAGCFKLAAPPAGLLEMGLREGPRAVVGKRGIALCRAPPVFWIC